MQVLFLWDFLRYTFLAILLEITYNANRIACDGDDNIVCGRRTRWDDF